jgi:hypothetical protein
MPTISIHVCTKDRPHFLRELVADLETVIAAPKEVFVYDDSVEPRNRSANRAHLAALPFPAVYVGEGERRRLLDNMPWPSERARSYATYAFKELGRPQWDHAGVRGLAHGVAAALAHPRQKLLFLDDDIRLTQGTFQGRHYTVDAAAVARALAGDPPDRRILGAKYVGRADVYLVEHIKRAPVGQGPQQTGKTGVLAYQGTERVDELAVDVPISGAFLFMCGEHVRRAPIPHCFNEDCVFVSVLMAHGYQAAIAPFQPLHTGDVVPLDLRLAPLQQNGVVILKAIADALKSHDVGDVESLMNYAVSLCELYVDRAVSIWEELLASPLVQDHVDIDTDVLLDRKRVLRESTEAITSYFASWPGWNDLVSSPDVARHIADTLLSN